MSEDLGWEFIGASGIATPFEIDGLDVWEHKWEDTKECVSVKDPEYHQIFNFTVWHIKAEGRTIEFVAGEFSNCIYGFYLRK